MQGWYIEEQLSVAEREKLGLDIDKTAILKELKDTPKSVKKNHAQNLKKDAKKKDKAD